MSIGRIVARHLAAVSLLLTLTACGSGGPTTPAPPPTPQGPVISITGNLGFGTVQVGSPAQLSFTISNPGGQPLIVSNMTLTGGGLSAVTRYSWISGTIPAGGQQVVVVTFTPTSQVVYSGTLTVVANHISGTNTILITGGGTLTGVPVFFRQGVGDSVFDIPSHVTRVIITASYNGSSQNFILRVGGSLIVNELMGTAWQQTIFIGTYQITPGVVQITSSSGVAWTFHEFRQ